MFFLYLSKIIYIFHALDFGSFFVKPLLNFEQNVQEKR